MVGGLDMDTPSLIAWAKHQSDGVVENHSDKSLSLTSKLLRFRWNDAPAVAVASDADAKTRINAVLDGVAWFLATAQPADDTLHIVVGVPPATSDGELAFKEPRDAIGTLVTNLRDGPSIQIWLLDPGSEAKAIEAKAASFTTKKPAQWSTMLEQARVAPVKGFAGTLLKAVDHPSLALYPKLSSPTGVEPWQLRLDGLEIGRVGASSATLALNSRDLQAHGEPRATWRNIAGNTPIHCDDESLTKVVDLIREVIDAWSDDQHPGAVLQHGSAEHALEAHILSGRLTLATSADELRLAIPNHDRVLRAAQFPTLWGDVTSPARYLDALLADSDGRPWAIELKDQEAGGGHGAYLRYGIGQAVLYRHYIRSAPALDGWFENLGLNRSQCQAALAFPTPKPAAAKSIAAHHDLAERFGVDVIEFPRPGTSKL